MKKYIITGPTGAGKSTISKKIARTLEESFLGKKMLHWNFSGNFA